MSLRGALSMPGKDCLALARNDTREQGFTLIELLIVIAIIGLLATFTTVNLLNSKQRARDAQRKSDMAQIQAGLELYKSDQNSYPPAPLPSCGTALSANGSTYIAKIPCDPTNTGQYVYKYSTTGTTYTITTCLENVNDSKKDATNNSAVCTGGTTNWSYTVTNP